MSYSEFSLDWLPALQFGCEHNVQDSRMGALSVLSWLWAPSGFKLTKTANWVVYSPYMGTHHTSREQHKAILQRKLPDNLKLAIAKTIENNLFSKVAALIPVPDRLEWWCLKSPGPFSERNAWFWWNQNFVRRRGDENCETLHIQLECHCQVTKQLVVHVLPAHLIAQYNHSSIDGFKLNFTANETKVSLTFRTDTREICMWGAAHLEKLNQVFCKGKHNRR